MKLMTLIAVAIGYYLGAKAGAQRYNQIQFLARSVANSHTFQNLLSRIGETLTSAVEAVTGQRPETGSSAQQSNQS